MTQATETSEPLAPTAAPCGPSENATLLHYSSDPPPSHVLQASAAILRTTLPVCHVTPYASRQKLNTDIGIIQLATRILLRGTQRRPRMTTQGHNLNVRTRKLSPVPSFRADRECGSSGPSTLTLRALSDRSLRALPMLLLPSRRSSEQTKRWETTRASCAHVVSVWLGWGRAPNGGGTAAASPRSFARPAGASLRPYPPCARTPTRH